jgi:NADPH2:quinone reductase
VPRFVAEVLPHIAAGRSAPQIDKRDGPGRLPQAKARMEDGGHVGKIILRIPQPA